MKKPGPYVRMALENVAFAVIGVLIGLHVSGTVISAGALGGLLYITIYARMIIRYTGGNQQ